MYRYDAAKDALICDELGVSYPIVAGIPRLTPLAGQLLDTEPGGQSQSQSYSGDN